MRTSRTLIEQVQEGQREAWEQLVELYMPLVHVWCRRWLKQQADIDDVAQEVFKRVYCNVRRFEYRPRVGSFRAWVRTITFHSMADRHREMEGIPGIVGVGGDVGFERLMEISFEEDSRDSRPQEIAEETSRLYHRMLDFIRHEFRESTWRAFYAVAVDGRRPRDVAKELKTSLNAVYLAKSRVCRRLRSEFDGLEET